MQFVENYRLTITDTILLTKSQEICKKILKKEEKTTRDLLQFDIYLHLCLEIWVNNFLKIVFKDMGKSRLLFEKYPRLWKKIIKLSFSEKIEYFLLFSENPSKNTVNCIKDFSHIRNMILHWEPIESISLYGTEIKIKNKDSVLKKNINMDVCKKQIKLYKKIIEGIIESYKNYPDNLRLDKYWHIVESNLDISFLNI